VGLDWADHPVSAPPIGARRRDRSVKDPRRRRGGGIPVPRAPIRPEVKGASGCLLVWVRVAAGIQELPVSQHKRWGATPSRSRTKCSGGRRWRGRHSTVKKKVSPEVCSHADHLHELAADVTYQLVSQLRGE
jgi:hypothetical protein